VVLGSFGDGLSTLSGDAPTTKVEDATTVVGDTDGFSTTTAALFADPSVVSASLLFTSNDGGDTGTSTADFLLTANPSTMESLGVMPLASGETGTGPPECLLGLPMALLADSGDSGRTGPTVSPADGLLVSFRDGLMEGRRSSTGAATAFGVESDVAEGSVATAGAGGRDGLVFSLDFLSAVRIRSWRAKSPSSSPSGTAGEGGLLETESRRALAASAERMDARRITGVGSSVSLLSTFFASPGDSVFMVAASAVTVETDGASAGS